MPSYFKDFPTILYRGRYAPNILATVRLRYDVLESSEIYHPFLIAEGDRPDTVADLYYQDPEADWLIYLANNIIDIKSEWPLTSTQLEQYILKKYGSHTESHAVKHYVIKTDIPPISEAQYNNLPVSMRKYWSYDYSSEHYIVTNIAGVATIETYQNMSIGERVYWRSVSNYTHEFNLNESKRKIRLIDKTYKTSLEQTLKDILNG